VWASEVEPLLVADEDGGLEAKTVFAELQRRHPDQFDAGQLRTLQRRFRDWRAQHGPTKEVFFPQAHEPGRMGALDFTHATELRVTIAGVLFVHMFFHLVMPFSGWLVAALTCETFPQAARAVATGRYAALLPSIAASELPPAVATAFAVPGLRPMASRLVVVARTRTLESRPALAETFDRLRTALRGRLV
jgi:hypothetical protein